MADYQREMAQVPTPQCRNTPRASEATIPSPAPTVPATQLELEINDFDSDEDFIDSRANVEQHVPEPMVTPLPKPRPSSRPRNDGFTTQSERERFYALPDRQPDEVVSPAVPTPRVPSSRVPSTVISQSGTLTSQPAITEPEIPTPEPFEDLEGLGIIPDVRDKAAPRFKPGQHTLSAEAIRSRSNRIFSKRADGSKKVSDEIWNDWKSKGPKKQLLEDIFRRCGYDPETWFLRRFFFQVIDPFKKIPFGFSKVNT